MDVDAPGTRFEVHATPAERALYATADRDGRTRLIRRKVQDITVLVEIRRGTLHRRAYVREEIDPDGPTFRIVGWVEPDTLAVELEARPDLTEPVHGTPAAGLPGLPAARLPGRPRRTGRRRGPARWPSRVMLALTAALGGAAWGTVAGVLPARVPWWAWPLPLLAWARDLPFLRRGPRRVRRNLDRRPIPPTGEPPP